MLETSRVIGISMASLAYANRDMVGDVFTEPGRSAVALRYSAGQTMSLLGETCSTPIGSTSGRRSVRP